jgi:dTMP kinase
LRSRQATLPFARDRIEEADQQFFERAAKGYQDIAAAEPNRVKVLDANAPVETVCARIWEQVQAVLPKTGRW